jgi:hypothetical protein
MDIEAAEAIDTLRTDIRRSDKSLTAEIGRVEASLTAKIEGVETSLAAKVERVETSLTAKMHELNEDAKRHADVQFESVRDDIRILAEGFATLSARIDSRR